MSAFYYKSLYSHINNRIVFSGLTEAKISVACIMTSEFAIGGENTFNQPFDILRKLQETVDVISMLTQSAADKASLGVHIPEFSVRSRLDSIRTWTNSSIPRFSASVVFIAGDGNNGVGTDDVRIPVKAILSAVYPSATNSISPGSYGTPLGYLPSTESAHGTLQVSVGKWFLATEQVMESANFTFSKECTASGTPLFAVGQISFGPYRLITHDELNRYLRPL